MNTFMVVSHRRSGTHFLWETLNTNFKLIKNDSVEGHMGGFKWHRPYKYTPKEFIQNHLCVFLVRDPRDTLVSGWFYWQRGAEPSLNMVEFLKDRSFSEYIRGTTVEDMSRFTNMSEDSIDAGIYLDPVQHWLDYTEWSNHIYTIKFEDVKYNLIDTLSKFELEFGVDRKTNEYTEITNLVGHFPRKGAVGDWRTVLSTEDDKYILEKAGNSMIKLGYL